MSITFRVMKVPGVWGRLLGAVLRIVFRNKTG